MMVWLKLLLTAVVLGPRLHCSVHLTVDNFIHVRFKPTYYHFVTKHSSALYTSGKNHFHEMNGDVGMAGWK